MHRTLLAAFAAVNIAALAPAYGFSAGGTYLVTVNNDAGGTITYCAHLVSSGASGPFRDYGTVSFDNVYYTGNYLVFGKSFYAAVTSPRQGGDAATFTATIHGSGVLNTSAIDFIPSQGASLIRVGSFTEMRDGQNCTSGTQVDPDGVLFNPNP